MKNVAVIGPLRSGKDSVADYLVENYGYTRMAFADALKEEVVGALNGGSPEGGWTLERLNEEKTRLRPLLQVWGTEVRRSVDPNYWLDRLEWKVKRHVQGEGSQPIVVTDARFKNELDLLRKYDFIIVKLKMSPAVLRKHLHKVAHMSDEQIDTALAHASEREWQEYPDYNISFEVKSVPGKLDALRTTVAAGLLSLEAPLE